VKRKARERAENAADRMTRKLLEMASDTTGSEVFGWEIALLVGD
jgi:hypothetical protein